MNKVIINGFVGKEPEIKLTQNGKKVCSFSLAVEDGRNSDGSKKSIWVRFIAWENKAEYLERYVHKGDKLLVEGRISTRQYETNSGDKRDITEIVCDRLEIERSKDSSTGQAINRSTENAPRTASNGFTKGLEISDEDLPF